jgi:hypothetical protein
MSTDYTEINPSLRWWLPGGPVTTLTPFHKRMMRLSREERAEELLQALCECVWGDGTPDAGEPLSTADPEGFAEAVTDLIESYRPDLSPCSPPAAYRPY